MDKSKWGVHQTHCCKFHGCKYGEPDCPVVKGLIQQYYLCEYCHIDLEEEEYHKSVLNRVNKIKLLQKDLKGNEK